jgi:carboxyl-terminal processing protease
VVRPGGYKMADLPVFSKVLFYVRENYYERERINPKQMLLGALEFVQRDVPEIVVDALPPAVPTRVVVTVSGESRTFPIDRVDQPWSLRSTLQEILRFAQARLQPVPEGEEGRRLLGVEMAATNGMLYTLDPRSVLLGADDYAGMRTSADQLPGSTGVVLELDAKRRVQVKGFLPGAPAERGGVKVGDRIILIDDHPTTGLGLDEVVARLRGPIASGLDLTVERNGARGAQKVHVERAWVRPSSIDAGPRILTTPAGNGAPPAKVGYFHLTHLGADAAGAVEQALAGFARDGVTGIVVDLRGNSGGLYEQAARVADAFVKEGTLVSMVGGRPGLRKDEAARDDGREPQVPVAVLVNHETASGAEIVAAALRNAERAVVLGQHTFGVGTVQVLFDIGSPLVGPADGDSSGKLGLKLTTAQFLARGDLPIQLRGLAPDIELRGVIAGRIGQLTAFRMDPSAPKRSETAFEWALPPVGTLTPAGRPPMSLDYLIPLRTSEQIDDEPVSSAWPAFTGDDFVAAFAAELVARVRQPGRAAALAAAKPFVAEIAAREDARIAAAAAALKIDWRSGTRSSPPRLALKLEPISSASVRAGTVAKLRGTVTNSGPAPAFRVRAVLASDDTAFDGVEMPFGYLPPGESKTFELSLPVPASSLARTDVVRARVRDGSGDVAGAAAETTVVIEGRPAPALSFTCRATEAKPRGKRGPASISLVMQIRNHGPAAADQVEAIVHRANAPAQKDGMVLRVNRWFGAVAAGAQQEATFVVDLPAEPRPEPVDLDLTLADGGDEPMRARLRITPPSLPADGAAPAGSWHVTPPTVAATPPRVTVDAPAVAPGPTVRIAGEVDAEANARDVYIRVWNRTLKIPVRKVFYQNAPANSPRLSFEANVPIWPGSNVIQVHARDARGTETTRSVVVLSRTEQPAR